MKKGNHEKAKKNGMVRTRKDLSIRDGRMLSIFNVSQMIGNIVIIHHINHLQIVGILSTIQPSNRKKLKDTETIPTEKVLYNFI
jgi:hypothetical protein